MIFFQDGKALPNGPVVISPDGLFPSLYREGAVSFWIPYILIFLHFLDIPSDRF